MLATTENGWVGQQLAVHAAEIRKLYRAGVSKSEIACRVRIGRTSVRRIPGTRS